MNRTDYQSLSDAELMRHYRNGEQGALEYLFRRHRSFLLSLINSHVKNKSIAEDILQNACLAVVQAIQKGALEEPYNFKAYMAVSCHHHRINYHRSTATQLLTNSVSFEADTYDYESSENSPEDEFIHKKETESVVEKAIKRLEPRLQKPIELRMLGYTYSEISESLGLKLGTVKSRICFARRDLSTYLIGHGVVSS
jgi:RNA polymerase sigma-70 factor (ECF subfamily)